MTLELLAAIPARSVKLSILVGVESIDIKPPLSYDPMSEYLDFRTGESGYYHCAGTSYH
jgi:hypothetical protein